MARERQLTKEDRQTTVTFKVKEELSEKCLPFTVEKILRMCSAVKNLKTLMSQIF